MKATLLLAPLALVALAAQAQPARVTSETNTTILHSGQPAPVNYGPAPSFEQLDPDHDGTISREEAATYPPLLNDFDFIAHHKNNITRAQYERWNATQNRQ